MKNIYFYDTKIGKIGIADNGTEITNLYFPNESIPQDATVRETELIKEAGKQLQQYFASQRKDFSLPLQPAGSQFCQDVWQVLLAIPYGETRSYRAVAQAIGKEKAARAVGMAIGRNPIPIIIPCHRVIGSNGKLVGFGGGLPLKAQLLDLEKKNK